MFVGAFSRALHSFYTFLSSISVGTSWNSRQTDLADALRRDVRELVDTSSCSGRDEGAGIVLGKLANVTGDNTCDFTDMW